MAPESGKIQAVTLLLPRSATTKMLEFPGQDATNVGESRSLVSGAPRTWVRVWAVVSLASEIAPPHK